jgi:hypothetical protein
LVAKMEVERYRKEAMEDKNTTKADNFCDGWTQK